MKEITAKLISNRLLAPATFEMQMEGDMSAITTPGQFVNIQLNGCFLRRPISVCDVDGNILTIVYKAVGKGTAKMAAMTAGQALNLLTGLGNGYDLNRSGGRPLLIGGGAGVPPMYYLCRRLIAAGRTPTVILGFNTASEVFYQSRFESLGAEVLVTTTDGSLGIKGFVTDALKDLDYSFFYTCGPEPMFRALHKAVRTEGQYSFEERMGCGFGACMGCSCKTLTGNKRICKEGPVMESGEIIWND